MLCDGNVYASMLAWLRFAVGIINSNCHGWPEVVFFVREAGVVSTEMEQRRVRVVGRFWALLTFSTKSTLLVEVFCIRVKKKFHTGTQ